MHDMGETRSTYGEQEMPKIFSSETSFYDIASAKRSFRYNSTMGDGEIQCKFGTTFQWLRKV
jgi:hypothetical protein